MNNLSKLTALLLALLLAIGAPMAALAESNVITTEAEYKALAAQVLYDVLSTKESYMTYRDVQAYIEESEYSEFLESLEPAAREKLEAYIEELYWASFVTYIDVGPFMPPVYVSPETVDTESTVALMSLTRETTETEDETSGTEEEDTTADLADLYTNKTVVDNGDGTYTVTLESYAMGDIQVSTSTTSVPCDIILVLDVSTSMKESMSSTDTTTRLKALQDAVAAFLTSVKEDSTKTGTGHRVSIITFNADATIRTYLRRVDNADSYKELTEATIQYDNSGTDSADGLAKAMTVFDTADSTLFCQTGYNDPIKSTETERQRVVILFTDGYPTESGSNNFDAEFAANAINNANTLKASTDDDGYGATVYSVAVISSASPTGATELTMTSGNDTDGTQKVAMVNAYLHAVSSNYPDATAAEVTTTTSNFSIQTRGPGDNGGGSGPGDNSGGSSSSSSSYLITNGDANENGLKYYQTASTSSALTSIFQQISTQIQSGGTTVKLDSQTVVKDVVTPYFTIPDGASGVTAQSFDCLGYVNGEPTWATTATATYTATVANNTVEVTGFDFTHNYVADEGRVEGDSSQSGNFYGRKLVVTFDIKPVDGFLGGNDVETNLPGSGIWNPNVENNPVEDFVNPPNPDVYIYKLEVDGEDQHIYLSNTADLKAFTMNFCDEYTIKVYKSLNDERTEFDETSGLVSEVKYEVDGINNQYVTLTYTLKDAEGTVLGIYTIQPGKKTGEGSWSDESLLAPALDADAVYTVTCTITPTETGTFPAKTYTDSNTVYVYTPEVTFQDSVEKYYTEVEVANDTDFTYYNSNNIPDNNHIVWTHTYTDGVKVTVTDSATRPTVSTATEGATVTITQAKDSEGNVIVNTWTYTLKDADDNESTRTFSMSGTDPELKFAYDADSWQTTTDDNKYVINATKDVPVTVTTTAMGNGYTNGLELQPNQIKYIRNKYLTTDDDTDKDCSDVTCDAQNDYVANTAKAPAFVIHVYDVSSTLTVQKSGMENGESAIVNVAITKDGTTKTYTVVFNEDVTSVTFANVLIGSTYEVTEQTGWSWRYTLGTPVYVNTAKTIVADTSQNVVTIQNDRTNDKWMSDESAVENNLGDGTSDPLNNVFNDE